MVEGDGAAGNGSVINVGTCYPMTDCAEVMGMDSCKSQTTSSEFLTRDHWNLERGYRRRDLGSGLRHDNLIRQTLSGGHPRSVSVEDSKA